MATNPLNNQSAVEQQPPQPLSHSQFLAIVSSKKAKSEFSKYFKASKWHFPTLHGMINHWGLLLSWRPKDWQSQATASPQWQLPSIPQFPYILMRGVSQLNSFMSENCLPHTVLLLECYLIPLLMEFAKEDPKADKCLEKLGFTAPCYDPSTPSDQAPVNILNKASTTIVKMIVEIMATLLSIKSNAIDDASVLEKTPSLLKLAWDSLPPNTAPINQFIKEQIKVEMRKKFKQGLAEDKLQEIAEFYANTFKRQVNKAAVNWTRMGNQAKDCKDLLMNSLDWRPKSKALVWSQETAAYFCLPIGQIIRLSADFAVNYALPTALFDIIEATNSISPVTLMPKQPSVFASVCAYSRALASWGILQAAITLDNQESLINCIANVCAIWRDYKNQSWSPILISALNGNVQGSNPNNSTVQPSIVEVHAELIALLKQLSDCSPRQQPLRSVSLWKQVTSLIDTNLLLNHCKPLPDKWRGWEVKLSSKEYTLQRNQKVLQQLSESRKGAINSEEFSQMIIKKHVQLIAAHNTNKSKVNQSNVAKSQVPVGGELLQIISSKSIQEFPIGEGGKTHIDNISAVNNVQPNVSAVNKIQASMAVPKNSTVPQQTNQNVSQVSIPGKNQHTAKQNEAIANFQSAIPSTKNIPSNSVDRSNVPLNNSSISNIPLANESKPHISVSNAQQSFVPPANVMNSQMAPANVGVSQVATLSKSHIPQVINSQPQTAMPQIQQINNSAVGGHNTNQSIKSVPNSQHNLQIKNISEIKKTEQNHSQSINYHKQHQFSNITNGQSLMSLNLTPSKQPTNMEVNHQSPIKANKYYNFDEHKQKSSLGRPPNSNKYSHPNAQLKSAFKPEAPGEEAMFEGSAVFDEASHPDLKFIANPVTNLPQVMPLGSIQSIHRDQEAVYVTSSGPFMKKRPSGGISIHKPTQTHQPEQQGHKKTDKIDGSGKVFNSPNQQPSQHIDSNNGTRVSSLPTKPTSQNQVTPNLTSLKKQVEEMAERRSLILGSQPQATPKNFMEALVSEDSRTMSAEQLKKLYYLEASVSILKNPNIVPFQTAQSQSRTASRLSLNGSRFDVAQKAPTDKSSIAQPVVVNELAAQVNALTSQNSQLKGVIASKDYELNKMREMMKKRRRDEEGQSQVGSRVAPHQGSNWEAKSRSGNFKVAGQDSSRRINFLQTPLHSVQSFNAQGSSSPSDKNVMSISNQFHHLPHGQLLPIEPYHSYLSSYLCSPVVQKKHFKPKDLLLKNQFMEVGFTVVTISDGVQVSLYLTPSTSIVQVKGGWKDDNLNQHKNENLKQVNIPTIQALSTKHGLPQVMDANLQYIYHSKFNPKQIPYSLPIFKLNGTNQHGNPIQIEVEIPLLINKFIVIDEISGLQIQQLFQDQTYVIRSSEIPYNTRLVKTPDKIKSIFPLLCAPYSLADGSIALGGLAHGLADEFYVRIVLKVGRYLCVQARRKNKSLQMDHKKVMEWWVATTAALLEKKLD